MASDYSSVTASFHAATDLVDLRNDRISGARPIVKTRSWQSMAQIDEPHTTQSGEVVPSTRGIPLSAVRWRVVSQRQGSDLPSNRAGVSQLDSQMHHAGSQIFSAHAQRSAVAVYPSGELRHSSSSLVGLTHSSQMGGVSGSGAHQRTGPSSPGSLAAAGASSLGSSARRLLPRQHHKGGSAAEENASWIAHVDALATSHRRQLHPRSYTLPELRLRPAEYSVDDVSCAPRSTEIEHGLKQRGLHHWQAEGSPDTLRRHGLSHLVPGLHEPPPALRHCGLASYHSVGRIATLGDALPDVCSVEKAAGPHQTASGAPQVKCETLAAMVNLPGSPARSTHVCAHAQAGAPIMAGGSSAAAELKGQNATAASSTGIRRNIAFAAEDREAAMSRASALLPASDDDTDSDGGGFVDFDGAPASCAAIAGAPVHSGVSQRSVESNAAAPHHAAPKHDVEGSDIDEVIAALLGF